MSVLSLDLGESQLQIDLGEIDEHGTSGELIYSGNIYLHIDGREYGSLFITRGPDGGPLRPSPAPAQEEPHDHHDAYTGPLAPVAFFVAQMERP